MALKEIMKKSIIGIFSVLVSLFVMLLVINNFDDGIGKWQKISNLFIPRAEHVSIMLDSDNILILGGSTYKIKGNFLFVNFLKTAELYNFKTGEHKNVGDVHCTGYLTPFKKDNRIFVIGCRDGIVEEYNPVTQTFSVIHKNNIHFERLFSATNFLVLKNGDVFVSDSKTPRIYNPITNKSFITSEVVIDRFREAFLELANGNILISGGYDNNNLLKSIEMFDKTNNSYKIIGEMQYPRHNHTMMLLPENKVLIVGGRGINDINYLDDDIFKKNLYINPKNNKYFYQDLLQDIEIYDLNTNKSTVVGKLKFALGENLVLNLLDNKYVLVSEGIGKRDELIDIRDYKTYPVKKIKKGYSRSYTKLNKDIFIIGGKYRSKYFDEIIRFSVE